MRLPNLSASMYVAWLRFIQSRYEPLEHRNPDVLVRHFIPVLERWRVAWIGPEKLSRLRGEPFYYYLVARTKYYDQVVAEAVSDGVQRIIMIGCGTDTRAYRFQALLRGKGVKVLECDQSATIHLKQRLARRWRPSDYVEYLPIDLNDGAWPTLERWLGGRAGAKTLVLMEGVCAYIDDTNFRIFLKFLAARLPAGSQLAYDFKIRGFQDDLGREGRTQTPFRLPQQRDEVTAFHGALGLRLKQMELSSEISTRLVPGLAGSARLLFREDALVSLQPADSDTSPGNRTG